jgi:lipopolysaccharide/colanic/teichoic acid biosynthesis glycosyltransferase
LTPALALLALTLDLGLLLAITGPSASLPVAIVAIPVLAWLRHLDPRPRSLGTVLAAALLASCAIGIAGALASVAGGSTPLLATIAGALAAPWPGHALAFVARTSRALPSEAPLVHDGMARAVKRTMDVALAIVLGLPAVPVLAIAAVLVRLTSRGSALYSQTRVTLGGRNFRIWKLRTMVADAEQGKARWPEENDPRITPLGRLLRRVWLDEVPQLWNVLCGDMSLVGPRPERPEFVEGFAAGLPKYQERHAVRAGITGLAQVKGLIGNTSIRRRLALDLLYVRSWSPRLDVRILADTVAQALRRAVFRRTLPSGCAAEGPGARGATLGLGSSARHLPERDQRDRPPDRRAGDRPGREDPQGRRRRP